MLHQTLISPFSSFPISSPSSSSSPSLARFTYSHSSQVEKERRMESVEFGTEDFACVDFVDELLNLEEEEKEAVKVETFEEEEEEEEEEQENEKEKENSSLSSSFRTEAPPVEELSLPAHDVAELEWVSRIMDESLSEFPTYQAAPKPRTQPQPAAPALVPVKAKRSKRTRTPSGSWSSWGPLHHTDEDVTTASSVSSSSSASYSSQLIFAHHVLDEIPAPPPAKKHKPKKRGRKPKNPGQDSMGGGSAPAAGERRCSHCGVNKTPQWRTGPNGAKTLCNACGVRYKSGRLLPEYRPACSPTFVSHVHSNSHRKVLEMRRKKEEQEGQLLLHVPVVASF